MYHFPPSHPQETVEGKETSLPEQEVEMRHDEKEK